jgi:hypothetical protein
MTCDDNAVLLGQVRWALAIYTAVRGASQDMLSEIVEPAIAETPVAITGWHAKITRQKSHRLIIIIIISSSSSSSIIIISAMALVVRHSLDPNQPPQACVSVRQMRGPRKILWNL